MKGSKSTSLPLLDLHGAKTEDVADRLDRFISDHAHRGTPRVRVMPGKGTGKVKAEVIEYLRLGRYPWVYEKMPNGERNEGVLVVILA